MAQEAQAVDGVPVVVVSLPDDRIRRRVYMNLPAAERAAKRARQAGRRATLILCELRPIQPPADVA